MSIVLLSGVVIWWPKTKKALKSRLTVSTNKGFRRFVYDSHVSLGIYVFIFLFLMALTGPVFSFGWYRAGMSKLFGQPMPPKEMKMQQPKDGMKQGGTNDKAFAPTDASQMKGQPQTHKEGAKDMKGDQHGKKPRVESCLSSCIQVHGADGSHAFSMLSQPLLVASSLLVVTTCGGREEVLRRKKHKT